MHFYLTVKPDQRSNRVERTEKGWQIRLAAPAVEGQANEVLVRYVAALLGLPRTSIKLVKGHTSRIKCLDIPLGKEAIDAVFAAAAG